MFFGTPYDLKKPKLDSRYFGIDFTRAVRPSAIVPNCLALMTPCMEGTSIGFVRLETETGENYAIPVVIYQDRAFADQCEMLIKILKRRNLLLLDYRILGPAWDEDLALALERFQITANQLERLGNYNGFIDVDLFAQGLDLKQTINQCTDHLNGILFRMRLPAEPTPPPTTLLDEVKALWRSFRQGLTQRTTA